jgi:type IV pilus assembly protein PilF
MRPDRVLASLLVALLLSACASGGGPARKPDANRAAAAELQLKLGQGYLEQGQHEIALERLKRALELDPTSAQAHTVLGVLYEEIGRRELAETHYRRSLALKPDSGMMMNNFGTFLCNNGRYAESEQYFLKALEDPFYRTPETALGNAASCARQDGRNEVAEGYYRRLLELQPQNATALLDMAMLMYVKGDAMRARAFMQRFESLGEVSAESLALASRIESSLGDAAAARRYLDALRAKFPDSSLARDLPEPN